MDARRTPAMGLLSSLERTPPYSNVSFVLWPAGTTFGREMLTSSPSWPLRSASSEFPEESRTPVIVRFGCSWHSIVRDDPCASNSTIDARRKHLAFRHQRGEDLVRDGAKSRLLPALALWLAGGRTGASICAKAGQRPRCKQARRRAAAQRGQEKPNRNSMFHDLIPAGLIRGAHL